MTLPHLLPPATELWMGDLHRAFSASPADVANAVLRKRIAALEAENARLRDEAGADETARDVDNCNDSAVRAEQRYRAFKAKCARLSKAELTPHEHWFKRLLKRLKRDADYSVMS